MMRIPVNARVTKVPSGHPSMKRETSTRFNGISSVSSLCFGGCPFFDHNLVVVARCRVDPSGSM
jgi:hypothetical protein